MNYFTKTRVLVAIIVVLGVTLLATIGTMVYGYYKQKQFADNVARNPQERMEQQANFLRDRLNLTPSQEDIFRKSRDEFHEKTVDINRKLQRVSIEIINELSSPEPDLKLIDSLVEHYGELHKAEKKVMIDHLMEIKSACTPEQFQKFQRIVEHSQRRMMQRHRQRFQNERMRRGDSIPPRIQ
ncbi:Spy/CpxP family protein refolding chaperone [Tenuifilum osseticum]|uniref:Spy/CpxP family protein refolding chaperone n=1 Tax=Tenuifilum osseticum TaxID=3374723 RepID=UPI0034E4F76C